jgi:hypothetical protein
VLKGTGVDSGRNTKKFGCNGRMHDQRWPSQGILLLFGLPRKPLDDRRLRKYCEQFIHDCSPIATKPFAIAQRWRWQSRHISARPADFVSITLSVNSNENQAERGLRIFLLFSEVYLFVAFTTISRLLPSFLAPVPFRHTDSSISTS